MIEYMNSPGRDRHPDHSDQANDAGPAALSALPPISEDPARHVGEIFRRLTLASEAFPGAAFARIVAAVLVALGRAALEEAERQAARLRERTAPAPPGIRVSATARRADFDGLDVNRPEWRLHAEEKTDAASPPPETSDACCHRQPGRRVLAESQPFTRSERPTGA